MKSRYVVYGIFILSLGFAAAMGYLFYSDKTASGVFEGHGPPSASAKFPSIEFDSDSKPVSGRGGSLIIAYAGDIAGNMLPCG